MQILRSLQIVLFIILHSAVFSQQSKEAYLKKNASVLNEAFVFPKNINVVGFGAYHGSSKTEDAELILVKSLIKNNGLAYYFTETDISIAHYFNEYLQTGNEALLISLIDTYGTRIPQERTIEVFTKWKKLKELNDKLPKNKKITVLGADPVVTYQYTYRHLLSLINNTDKWAMALQLQETVVKDTTDFSPYYNSYSKNELKAFIADYEANTTMYLPLINDKPMFNHLITTIKVSFDDSYKREKEMYNNYLALVKLYKCENKLQFFRLGFSHLLKAKKGNSSSFFAMLADNKIYPKDKIVSVLGYLTKSEVIWEDNYKDGEYVSSVTNSDEGTGDSATEYFKGIEVFKDQNKGDLTIYGLNKPGSPYSKPGCTDMVDTIPDKKPANPGNAATTYFIDYAVLISNSAASHSIYSLKK